MARRRSCRHLIGDLAVDQVDLPVAAGCQRGIVGDQQQGRAGARAHREQQVHHRGAGGMIEVAGRLVLPEPDGPTRPTASAQRMSRSTPRRMLTGPAAEGTVKLRSRTRMSGVVEAEAVAGGGMASMAAAYGVRMPRNNPASMTEG